MKFDATDISAFMDAFDDDTTATFGAQSFSVFMHKVYITSNVGGEQIESKEQTAITPNSTLAALSPSVEHGSSLTINSTSYRVDGIQEDDPTEGFTRLILTEV